MATRPSWEGGNWGIFPREIIFQDYYFDHLSLFPIFPSLPPSLPTFLPVLQSRQISLKDQLLLLITELWIFYECVFFSLWDSFFVYLSFFSDSLPSPVPYFFPFLCVLQTSTLPIALYCRCFSENLYPLLFSGLFLLFWLIT